MRKFNLAINILNITLLLYILTKTRENKELKEKYRKLSKATGDMNIDSSVVF